MTIVPLNTNFRATATGFLFAWFDRDTALFHADRSRERCCEEPQRATQRKDRNTIVGREADYKSLGWRPVLLAMRASMRGPISS
jgi:hypothetical protein